MATDMAKVRRFENGLKFSIRGRIVGLRLQDMDSMVGTSLTIEREIEVLRALGMRVLVAKGRRVSLLLVRERSRGLLVHVGSKARLSGPGTDQGCRSGWADGVLSLQAARTHEEGLPPETRILRFRDSAVPVSGGTGEDIVHSFTPQYRPEEPVSVSGSCTSTFLYTSRLERPYYRPRQRTRSIDRDVRGSGACLRHHTID